MRKNPVILITLLAVTTILLSACSSASTSPDNLASTSWSLVSYSTTISQSPSVSGGLFPAVVDVETSLDFGKDGIVSGRLGCNQFSGDYSIKGDTIIFGMIAATEMACPEPQMAQESAAFQVMNGTVRFDINSELLTIYSADESVSLTLSRK